MTAKKQEKGKVIKLQKLNVKQVRLRVRGKSPLISHSWSFKAMQEMLGTQTRTVRRERRAKDPWMDFCESLYWLTPKPYDERNLPEAGDETYPTEEDIKKGTFGIKSIAFKCAMVTAVTSMSNMTKILARQAFHIENELTPIIGTPVFREDTVRLSNGSADLRYRGELNPWEADIVISYNANVVSDEQIVNLLNTAGFGVGVGDWRPDKNGDKGRFGVVTQ